MSEFKKHLSKKEKDRRAADRARLRLMDRQDDVTKLRGAIDPNGYHDNPEAYAALERVAKALGVKILPT